MNLESIMLSESSQTQKPKYWMIPLCECPEEAEGLLVVANGWGRGEQGLTANSRVSSGGMKMFWNETVVIMAQPCEYTKNH